MDFGDGQFVALPFAFYPVWDTYVRGFWLHCLNGRVGLLWRLREG